jgi:hypothetical protein
MELVVERIASFREHLLTCDGREASQKSLSLAEPDGPTCNFRKRLHSRQKWHSKQSSYAKMSQTFHSIGFSECCSIMQNFDSFFV